MERILINNEWYVKEVSQEADVDVNIDFTFTKSCIVETDNFCFEATRIMRDYDGDWYPDISIDVTIKQGDSIRVKEYWDNPEWMRGILTNDEKCLEELIETVTEKYDQQVLIKMLWKLDDIGWL